MSNNHVITVPNQLAAPRNRNTTPTGLQSSRTLARRRLGVAVVNVVTYAALLWWAATILSAGGWSLLDGVLMAAFAVGTPWTVLGFWNAALGLWLLHATRTGWAQTAPFAQAADEAGPLTTKTAVLMTLRNEAPDRAISRLKAVKASIDRTGHGAAFSYFVLSDTNDPKVATAEEQLIADWKEDLAGETEARIVYRRRTDNTGFKAGNVRDFCQRWGHAFDFMLPLDADSVMSGDSVVRLVKIMETHPRLGILQSLVVGMPSDSAFARIFQFGMRHGMRPYTMGQAWWTGDCGPFWGHNALVRIKPFYEHCELPTLSGRGPLSGAVMSHDQVEATLMRRAGYEVRVLPLEEGSWEENPPTMLDFAKRDVRWCQGNLQYVKLLRTPGLHGISRFQLVWAILMFLGLPAWTLMIGLLPFAAMEANATSDYPTGLAIGLYLTFFALYLSPKIAGLIDVTLTRGGVAKYGGAVRFAFGAAIEFVFSFLQGAISSFRTSIFMIGLLFGKKVSWGGQSRDAYGLGWQTATAQLWPQTLFGIAICTSLLIVNPTVLAWSLPLTAGFVLAIPFAVITASPSLGRLMKRSGLCGIPEDFNPPIEIGAIQAKSANAPR